MKKLLYYTLGGLTCFIIFSAFMTLTAGIGVFFIAFFWNGVIVTVWRKITNNSKTDNNEAINELKQTID